MLPPRPCASGSESRAGRAASRRAPTVLDMLRDIVDMLQRSAAPSAAIARAAGGAAFNTPSPGGAMAGPATPNAVEPTPSPIARLGFDRAPPASATSAASSLQNVQKMLNQKSGAPAGAVRARLGFFARPPKQGRPQLARAPFRPPAHAHRLESHRAAWDCWHCPRACVHTCRVHCPLYRRAGRHGPGPCCTSLTSHSRCAGRFGPGPRRRSTKRF